MFLSRAHKTKSLIRREIFAVVEGLAYGPVQVFFHWWRRLYYLVTIKYFALSV